MADDKESVLRKLGRALMGKSSKENLTPEEQKRRKRIVGGTSGTGNV